MAGEHRSSFPLISYSRCNISVLSFLMMQSRRQRQLTTQAMQQYTTLLLHDFDGFEVELLTVKVECGEVRKCKCNMNSTPARRVTPP